eukprot:COSAG06_NODE_1066_length_10841_cov_14.808806_4_plen_73_part_00
MLISKRVMLLQCDVGSLDRLITGTTAGGGAAGGVAPELPWMMRVRLATGARNRLSLRHFVIINQAFLCATLY